MTMPEHAVHEYDRYNPLPPTAERAEIMRQVDIQRQARTSLHAKLCKKRLSSNPDYSVIAHCLRRGYGFSDYQRIKTKLQDEGVLK